ncbi:MAG: lysoplasmalogenase [Clostridia bacterium]|nr:lysoplasmalogenase [Clostridia bacterium]
MKFYLALAFVFAEISLYAVFLSRDIGGTGDTVGVKYAGIVLCVIASFVSAFFYGRDGVFLTVALLFTALSDLFLLVLNSHFEVGVAVFILAQATYFLRIYYVKGERPLFSVAVRLIFFAAVLVVLIVLKQANLLTVLTAFYFINLLFNAVESFSLIKISRKYLLFSLGLCLFVCCDACVGLNNFPSVLGVNLPVWISDFVAFAMWGFYLPSQVLIVLSAKKKI